MLNLLFSTWFIIFILMNLVWLIFLWDKNPGIVDVFWPIAIGIAALKYSLFFPFTVGKVLLQCLLILWALRLSGFLFLKRILPRHREKRYLMLSESWKRSKNLGFLLNFQFQGLLSLGVAAPFLFIANLTNQFTPMIIIALVVVAIGLFGESLADYQLQTFKNTHSGKVCDLGLWRYSRHPNYFFEWLVWLGFAIGGLSTSVGWIGFFSPALLLFLMLKITVPLTERGSIEARGNAYLEYQKVTPIFFPWLRGGKR